MTYTLSAVIAGNKLAIAIAEGQSPQLTDGWRAASIRWPNEACEQAFMAYAHDDPDVVQTVQTIVCELDGAELAPGMDYRYLYIPRP